MSEQTEPNKIKLVAKLLTVKQRWNVFVRLLPWSLIIAFALLFAGMNIGHTETVNGYSHDAAIKDAAVLSVSKN